jgi:hypothetical protein
MTKFLNNADVTGYISQTSVTSSLLKTDSAGKLVAATAGTDYQTPTTALLPAGGTAGQILSKIDATNYNTQWIDNFASQIKYEVKLGAALTKGTPVYVSSANGTNMIVSASSNATEATSSKTLGLLETGGALNDIVKVVSDGLLAGLDTSTALAGDPVWLGPSGTLLYGLANKPSAPVHMVFIGIVTRAQSVNGEIFVKVQNGFELEELHNVAISSVANNEGLFWESATSLWKNKTIAAVLGYTPVDASLTTNYITKATGATTLGNSNIQDSGSLITLGSNSYVNGSLGIGSTSLTGYELRIGGTITGATTSYGVSIDGTIQSDVTTTVFSYHSRPATIASAFTLTNLVHFQALQGTFGAGSTVTNQVGFDAGANIAGATNNYGFRGQLAAATNNWNLYMSGTANNYLAGSLGIGATNLTAVNLFISKSITGNIDSYSVNNNGTVQSDVTNSATYYRSGVSTVAATFTLATLQHYIANQGTFGAGSTVTNQYGFVAANTLVGATNNYGFYGAIPSGTNRWNLYMVGTAANYMAGQLLIGTTTTSVFALDVNTGGINGIAEVARFASTGNGAAGRGVGVIISAPGSTNTVSVARLVGYQESTSATANNASFAIQVANSSGTLTEYLRINNAGGVGIGASTIVASARLQVDSTTQGFLPPRMTATQRAAISTPAEGLVVFQTDGTIGLYVYANATWRTLAMV